MIDDNTDTIHQQEEEEGKSAPLNTQYVYSRLQESPPDIPVGVVVMVIHV
jgi:hypothetical protein